MCGIAGAVGGRGTDLAECAARMAAVLRHRGPDRDGLWADDYCALGHQRLAIVDLSPAGDQPLSNEDGNLWITFNGEIYNCQALRRELEAHGHHFRSATDTEVIVHAYEQWGPACVQRLCGMFAFALWDRRKRRLLLAHDRVVKKPLFYIDLGDRLLFASELQGIMAEPDVPRDIDEASIDAYLRFGFIPAPDTAFRTVRKLAPAHWMTVEVDPFSHKLKIQTERYWQLAYGPKLNISEDDARDGLREKLSDAVRQRLIADVPIGMFLSGGVDSSIIVGLMANVADEQVRTFTIGFDSSEHNEVRYARQVAQRWCTEHHEFIVKPEASAILPLLIRHYGEPYADSSAIPTYYLARMARSSVTVALNGDGGDENFAGYPRHFGNHVASLVRHTPGGGRLAAMIAPLLPDSLEPNNSLRKARRLLAVARHPMPARFARWLSIMGTADATPLYAPEFAATVQSKGTEWLNQLCASLEDLSPVDAALAIDVNSYLPYDLLVKVDITTMASGLEARSPFLDHEVMEFVARLPEGYKLRGCQTKYLARQTFKGLLVKEAVDRRKMGFTVPVAKWLRGELRSLLQDALLSSRAQSRSYLRQDKVRDLIFEHLKGTADHSALLWALLMLEMWHWEFIDAAPLTSAYSAPAVRRAGSARASS